MTGFVLSLSLSRAFALPDAARVVGVHAHQSVQDAAVSLDHSDRADIVIVAGYADSLDCERLRFDQRQPKQRRSVSAAPHRRANVVPDVTAFLQEFRCQSESKAGASDNPASVFEPELGRRNPANWKVSSAAPSLNLTEIGIEVLQRGRVAMLPGGLEIASHLEKRRPPLGRRLFEPHLNHHAQPANASLEVCDRYLYLYNDLALSGFEC